MYSEHDQLIPSYHSKKLKANHGLKYRTRKVDHCVFAGQHNDFRGEACVKAVVTFILDNSRSKTHRVASLILPKKELEVRKIKREEEVKTQPNEFRKLSGYDQGVSRSWNLLNTITTGGRHQQTTSSNHIKVDKEYRQLSAGPRDKQHYFIAHNSTPPLRSFP